MIRVRNQEFQNLIILFAPHLNLIVQLQKVQRNTLVILYVAVGFSISFDLHANEIDECGRCFRRAIPVEVVTFHCK